MVSVVVVCPGCGLAAPAGGGARPDAYGASAECWERYGELLARSYGIAGHRPVHQLVVDAYVAQHPGGDGRREVQRLALCLMTLCLFVEEGADPRDGPALHKRMMAGRPDYFHWLRPPRLDGLMTVADVLAARDPAEHGRLVWEWGRDVWRAWEPCHATIRAWNARALT
ncbi:DUF5946 family protein [Nonomuraea montanisoli]|uniref:DUF5946 family protein n=1 Tax=Nonomuraea montanisoli TaxID=2741721 RepID=UPI002E283B84|nr:DUF5946 family protein [Nonomuraea montanisoli]